MSYFETLKAMDPNVIIAKAVKVFAVLGVVLSIVMGIYLYGRHDGKMACQAAINKVAVATAEERARNAVGASQRFSEYILNDRDLETWAIQAKADIADWYASTQPKPKTKVVYKQGSKEPTYVPIVDCTGTGNDVVFDHDELLLYNWGNKRSEIDTPNPLAIPGALPGGTSGADGTSN